MINIDVLTDLAGVEIFVKRSIDQDAEKAKKEIKAHAEFVRRSLGQKFRHMIADLSK